MRHRAAQVGERVETLVGGDGVGGRRPAGRDAPETSSRYFAAAAIMARAELLTVEGAMPLRPIDRAVRGRVLGGGPRPFPEAHFAGLKKTAPFGADQDANPCTSVTPGA